MARAQLDKDSKEKKFSRRPPRDDMGDDYGKDGDRKSFKRRERPPVDLIIDYKDVDSLRAFLSEGGRIVPARISRLNCTQQKKVTTEIKRARQLALVPMSDRHVIIK